MPKRRVFYSFHYARDVHRAARIRNIGAIESDRPCTDNEWEQVKRGGDTAIQRWIDSQLNGKSATIVLIGQDTASRPWVRYEIEKSWNDRKGLLGIYIHKMEDLHGARTLRGDNPFGHFTLKNGKRLSDVVQAYDPPQLTSKDVYNHIAANLETWVERAIAARLSA